MKRNIFEHLLADFYNIIINNRKLLYFPLRYVYNHALGRLFKNRLGHVLLLNPGCKRTRCWDLGNLIKPTTYPWC